MKKSFTLIELLIGMVIFMFLLIALNAFLGSAFSATFRALAMKRLADSTRGALELMGREMRLAQGNGSPCTSGGQSFEVNFGGTQIKFKDFPTPSNPSGRCITYRYDAANRVLRKNIDAVGEQDFLGVNTPPGPTKSVSVDILTFTQQVSATTQPRITINARVGTKDPTSANQTLTIDLQTTVSQREIQ